MLSSEHLYAGFPLVNENGPGLGIGLVKDGVVVVTAMLLSTKAMVSVFILCVSCWCVPFLRGYNGIVLMNFPLYLSQLTKELFIASYRKGFRRSVEGSNAFSRADGN